MTTSALAASPEIAPLPAGSVERLIDQGIMPAEASAAGLAERYARGETSHTIHVWWARRPHSAMRALVFATLCQVKSTAANEILREISIAPVVSTNTWEKARALLEEQWPDTPPRLLDMFGGGGTIPLEAASLGAETYCSDVNELSVFIQQCNLQYSQYLNGLDTARAVRVSGERVLKQLEAETKALFPLREYDRLVPDRSSPFGYLWTYSTVCSHCGYRFYLSKRRWLSRKKANGIVIDFVDTERGQRIRIDEVDKASRLDNVWHKGAGIVTCPQCERRSSRIDIATCQDELVAVVKPAKARGKEFWLAPDNAIPAGPLLAELEEAVLRNLGLELPSSALPNWSGIVNPAIYGVKTHADFLNPRQRVVLLLLIRTLRDEYERLCADYAEDTAGTIIGFLTGLVDQVVDWNCRLSMWIPQNEQVGRAFSGPGVAMLWDYVETDQVLHGPANLWSKLARIVKGVSSIPKFPHAVTVKKGPAQALDYPDDYFDAVVTDPPYYDNIYYSVLADFIYAWKRPILDLISPTRYASPTTDTKGELVASTNRSGSADRALDDYCEQLSLAFKEIERVLKSDGIFSFVYSHGSLQGWVAILRAYRISNLLITSVQPLSIERRQRPRAMTSGAINTCFVFVARPGKNQRRSVSVTELDYQLEEKLFGFAEELIQLGWKEMDAALATFANVVGMLANSAPNQIDDLEALRRIAASVRLRFPSFSIKDRKSL